ncbi:MAG: hypothetical protein HUK20_12170 [Fibrobacter sp.]|nr:hypothetical protein [Fibrobacter sp.]
MKRTFLRLPLLIFLALLYACSDSMDITFDESETRFISINAYTTRSFDLESDRKKQDTVSPGDSLIFLSTISPSKSIRLQRYYWNLDGKLFANEFSFKNALHEPGIHQMTFVLIDFFGDTLRDSVTLYVASHPTLDDTKFIPLDKTQSISPLEEMNFLWYCEQQDSLWQTFYRFTLTDVQSGQNLVDTLLKKNQFTYTGGFAPLSKYKWTVRAQNELGQQSPNTLENVFYTAGSRGESAITGLLKTTSMETDTFFDLTLQDSSGKVIREFDKTKVNVDGRFILKALPAGKYILKVEQKDKPDFTPRTQSFTLQPMTVHEISEITLKDTAPPSISALMDCVAEGDTLLYRDTLKFHVSDGGGTLKASRANVTLDEKIITSIQLQKDTLYVPMPPAENIWSYRILNVTLLDQSQNKASRYFYMKPKKSFDEVAND